MTATAEISGEVAEETKPQLPKGWRWARLGDVARVFAGSGAPQGKEYFDPNGPPFVRVSDLGTVKRSTNLITVQDRLSSKALKECSLVLAKAGTVVFPKSGAAITTNNRAILGMDAYIVGHLLAVEPTDDAISLWLYWALCQVDMMDYSDNTGYPSLKQSVVENIEIPLPPLAEQKRIAGILKEQMAAVERARASAEAQLQAAEHLPAAYLRTEFNSGEAQSWPTKRLKEICEIQLGKMLSPKSRTGIRPRPYLRNANVQWNCFDLSAMLEMDFDEREEKKFALKRGDLLVCEGGEPGRSAVWQGEIEPCFFQKALHRIRPIQDRIDPHFVMHRLWLGANEAEFSDSHAKTTIAHLPAVRLAELEIGVPPLADQRRIAARLSSQMASAERLCQMLTDQLDAINKLPAALLRRAFNGEL